MNPNTCSPEGRERPPGSPPDRLAALAAVVNDLAAQNLAGLPDGVRAQRVLGLRRLLDRLEGQWLGDLAAAVDACGAAGADKAPRRPRPPVGCGPASTWAPARPAAWCARPGPCSPAPDRHRPGPHQWEISAAHASVLAHGTHDLPAQTAAEAEPVLLDAARRLDPPQLRRVIAHLRLVADPEAADHQAERRHAQRWLWLAPTLAGRVALQGLLGPEAGQTLLAALEPLARPRDAHDTPSGGQRRADALAELARRAVEGGQLPQRGGVRPQLTITVDLDSLLGHQPTPARWARWAARPAGPDPQPPGVSAAGLRRRPHPGPGQPPPHPPRPPATTASAPMTTAVVRGAWRTGSKPWPPCCRRPWGAPPANPWTRASRVVTPAQRSALAVRDGGCVFPDCQRPLAWSEAHHLVHWADGGPTDLANLALVCRAHHRAVHEAAGS